MDFSPTLSPTEWASVRALARTGSLPVGIALIKKIKSGHCRFTEDVAIELHRATGGLIPVWKTRPDLWSAGQVPPSLAGLKVAS